MHGIVCVDDRMGMLFNRRRQSQDRILRAYLLNLVGKNRLLMNAYSGKQFEQAENICIAEDFLRQAGKEDYCFIEDQALAPWSSQLDTLILCRWNRSYPGDFFLDLDLSRWHLSYAEEFPGSSHEKITVEVFHK